MRRWLALSAVASLTVTEGVIQVKQFISFTGDSGGWASGTTDYLHYRLGAKGKVLSARGGQQWQHLTAFQYVENPVGAPTIQVSREIGVQFDPYWDDNARWLPLSVDASESGRQATMRHLMTLSTGLARQLEFIELLYTSTDGWELADSPSSSPTKALRPRLRTQEPSSAWPELSQYNGARRSSSTTTTTTGRYHPSDSFVRLRLMRACSVSIEIDVGSSAREPGTSGHLAWPSTAARRCRSRVARRHTLAQT